MTISYASDVTKSRRIGCFIHILARWKGSIYKLVWPDLLIFLSLYYAINLTYHFAMNENSKTYFEAIVKYCDSYTSLIPLSFVLGFFVNNIMTRWWNQYCSIPFPDNLAILVSASINGDTDESRIIRRTIMRYACLSFTMTLSLISPKVKKRFPTLDHYVQAGLLQVDEKQIIEELDREYPSYSKYWMPLAWAANITHNARHEGIIREDVAVGHILETINDFRGKLGRLLDYDWISMPLVYTQVVTLAVYTYCVTTLIGKQTIDPPIHSWSIYFPFISVLQFVFYMGWLKVAEVLINPFGEDEEDFEVVWMIDRNVQVSYLIVDKMHHMHPALVKDQFWSKIAPNRLPYTLASEQYHREYPYFSARNTSVNPHDQELIDPDDESTSTDGGIVSFIRNWFGGTVRHRRNRTISLENEMHHTVKEVTIDASNLSSNLTEIPQNVPVEGEINDFEQLKLQRLEQHRRKQLQYARMLKHDPIEEEKLLVEEPKP